MHPLNDVYFDLRLPQDRPFQVTGFGENAVDWVCRVPRYPELDSKLPMEPMLRFCGGQIATACSFWARLGLRTRYIGRVGDDEPGRFVIEELSREAMDLALEVVPGASSHHSLILVDHASGGRTILYDRDPALRYGPGQLNRAKFGESCLLHLDANDLTASVQAAAWANEAGTAVSVDIDRVEPGTERLLERARLLIASRGFVSEFGGTGDWRRDLQRVGSCCPGFVAVTRGAAGAAALWEGQVYDFPGFPVRVIDSTGAGDMFHAAFVYAVLRGWSVARCLNFANAAGALACTRLGARQAIPALEEILAVETVGEGGTSVDSERRAEECGSD
ncbi:MAG: carbohydrate kinase family protein [Acidobacteriota bacterium]